MAVKTALRIWGENRASTLHCGGSRAQVAATLEYRTLSATLEAPRSCAFLCLTSDNTQTLQSGNGGLMAQ